MTLSTTTTKVTYNGDGSTTAFAVSFIFWNNSDLRVIHRDALGVETIWVEATQYTLTGGSGATGTLTVKTTPTDYTPASGETLTIKDYQSEVQGDSLPLSGAFPSTVVEQRLDKITRLIQIHSEEIARSILLPETASLSGLQLPEPGAGELVRYSAGGTGLETVAFGDISTAIDTLLTGLATNDFLYWDNAQSAWVNLTPGATGLALLQDASAADARTELGLGTAALVDTGVADGNVPAMDATGYPAGDGSQITALTYSNITDATGKVLQTVQTQDGAVATGTTTIPVDDTIPQNTEGDEYMTLAITPKSASSRLMIQVVAHMAHSTGSHSMGGALFKDTIADAIAAMRSPKAAITNSAACVVFSHNMASPGTSEITFKFRGGCDAAGTTTFNGQLGSRILGGVMASSIHITEYLA